MTKRTGEMIKKLESFIHRHPMPAVGLFFVVSSFVLPPRGGLIMLAMVLGMVVGSTGLFIAGRGMRRDAKELQEYLYSPFRLWLREVEMPDGSTRWFALCKRDLQSDLTELEVARLLRSQADKLEQEYRRRTAAAN